MPAHKESAQFHSDKVAQLYDKLFSFEVKRSTSAYPIHKKLTFEAPEITDIYQWLIANLPLSDYQHILDAGCGVGYGCQELTRYTNAAITGISLSADEIAKAREYAKAQEYAQQSNSKKAAFPPRSYKKLSFKQLSFESLPPNSFDCILMVESLKHCSDLNNALTSVAQALTDNGVCYVVEDVYQTEQTCPKEHSVENDLKRNQQLCNDWHLKKLWSFNDLQEIGANKSLSLSLHSDLTPLMTLSGSSVIRGKLALFSMLVKLSKSSVWPIYRGGFILDLLYAQKQMRYQVLKFTKRVSKEANLKELNSKGNSV